jgi:membrane peptidoglycan carboxypeptidase
VTNFEDDNQGPINLWKAITVSDNSVFAQLTSLVGPKAVADTAKAMGITTPLQPYFSIGLGGEPATPLEMARAYATLADGGYRLDDSLNGNEPRAVACIVSPSSHGTCVPNSGTPKKILDPNLTAIEDQMLQGVIQSGTGTAAQLPGWTAAGKTGTTSNYGDAWFVGYTPDLVTAVWVGYPNSLVPMLHEYHGGPVVGGSYPALIWKAFMQKALPSEHDTPTAFPAPAIPYAAPVTATYRSGRLERDNGNCRTTDVIELFSGATLPLANCKPNEVDVPNVRGTTLAKAKARLLAQPLLSRVVWTPAKPGVKLGVVLRQVPATGTLSAYGRVKLFVARPNGRLK